MSEKKKRKTKIGS